MAALTVSTVELTRRRVFITHAYAEVHGKLVLDTAKTTSGGRCRFPGFLDEPLHLLDTGKAAETPVFTGPKGAPLHVNNFRARYLAPAVARCQAADTLFPTITPHDLRHTVTSLALGAGANANANANAKCNPCWDPSPPQ